MTSALTPDHDAAPWVSPIAPSEIDVVVCGGGLAGLSLGLQLLRTRPSTQVLVIERGTHPAPDAAFKVGESTGENAANYFARTLGLDDELRAEHVRKMGLRYFFSPPPGAPFAERAEVGPADYNTTWTFQLDRGRFENALARRFVAAGGTFIDASRIVDVTLADGAGGGGTRDADHVVRYHRDGRPQEVRARWVVDASGRRSLLKRQLGLAAPLDHDVNAVWFRVDDLCRVDELGSGDEFHARMAWPGRWTSTTHLMGRGYWVWLIPLLGGTSGATTSFGIVADEAVIPYERIATYERALEWLHAEEPELAAWLATRGDQVMDFKGLRSFAYSCTQMYSRQRWALTGEAGAFHDPLYSPGSDFIALSNTLICRFVTAELDGDPGWEARVEWSNENFLRAFGRAAVNWQRKYPIMGNPVVWTAKAIWDTFTYFTMIVTNFANGGQTDPDHMTVIGATWSRFHDLNHAVQHLFEEWDAAFGDEVPDASGFCCLSTPLIRHFNALTEEPVVLADLPGVIAENLVFLERVAAEIVAYARETLGATTDPADVDPYTATVRSPGSVAGRAGTRPRRRLASEREVLLAELATMLRSVQTLQRLGSAA